MMVHAQPTSVPPASGVKSLAHTSFYQEAHVITINRFELTADEIYMKVFGHLPRWLEALMKMKTVVARAMGYKIRVIEKISPFATELRVGKKAGFMEIKEKNQREIIAGSGDKILISVYKRSSSEVVVTTLVNVKTIAGKMYLVCMKLLQKPVAAYVVMNAVKSGRL